MRPCVAEITALAAFACFLLFPTTSTGQSRFDPRDVDRTSVRVDPIDLTETREVLLNGLNLGAVVADARTAAGIQKAADIWGLHVDLFVHPDRTVRTELLSELAQSGAVAIITDDSSVGDLAKLEPIFERINRRRGGGLGPIPVLLIGEREVPFAVSSIVPKDPFQAGFEAVREARARILPMIPKYDELFNLSFPVTPLPDTFFQPSKFPYPEPVIRSVRTVSSTSASAHAHTSCHAVALLGNMIHRTSTQDEDIFLLGFEGGNLALKAQPGSVTRDKLSAVMTSYIIGVRGMAGERRDLLSENSGLETSAFKPAFHVPEELSGALDKWKEGKRISDYQWLSEDEILLQGYRGADRRFRSGLFMVSSSQRPKTMLLEEGVDGYGRWVIEATSSQGFVQLLGEVSESLPSNLASSPREVFQHLRLAEESEIRSLTEASAIPIGEPLLAPPLKPSGGAVTQAGGMVAGTVGFPLGAILQKVADEQPRFQPYILALEGGFLVVTPEQELGREQLAAPIERVDIDERGPLGSDQTIVVSLQGAEEVTFRRTILNFGYLDKALSDVQRQALISGWEYVGARGRGLASNAVLHNFLGKHRKFMSSLNTWPSDDRPERPYIRWYVDGMQRLNFSLVTPEGWRQEFVEVPLRVPPIPRDVQLFSGISKLD